MLSPVAGDLDLPGKFVNTRLTCHLTLDRGCVLLYQRAVLRRKAGRTPGEAARKAPGTAFVGQLLWKRGRASPGKAFCSAARKAGRKQRLPPARPLPSPSTSKKTVQPHRIPGLLIWQQKKTATSHRLPGQDQLQVQDQVQRGTGALPCRRELQRQKTSIFGQGPGPYEGAFPQTGRQNSTHHKKQQSSLFNKARRALAEKWSATSLSHLHWLY